MTHVADLERKAAEALATLPVQHADFAKRLANGETRRDAYATVYERSEVDRTSEVNGSRLSRRAEVENAVGQLLDLKRATLARKIVEEYAEDAADVVNGLMRDKGERGAVRLKAAQDLLDRAGIGAAQRIEISAVPSREGVNEQREELAARIARVKAMESRLRERQVKDADAKPASGQE